MQRQDDGEGNHQECPPQPDRERYLAERKRRMPNDDAWHQAIDEGREPWKEDG